MIISHWLYHRVPDPIVGDTLYPLNRLDRIYPEVAAKEKRKYDLRKNLVAVRLPILNCLWNDVIHLSPLHPSKIKESLIKAGCLQQAPRRSYFVIDPQSLEPGGAVFFRHSKDTNGNYDFLAEDFSLFESSRYRELESVPEEQLAYFIQMRNEGKKPLLWARTSHVLFQGEIKIKDVEIVEW